MPTFNQNDYIAHSIRSVLNQTHPNLRLIISDNSSTDGTVDTVKSFLSDARVTLLQNPTNLGIVPNWKKCLEALDGSEDYVCLLPSDDAIEPEHFEVMLEFFERFPNASVVHCDAKVVNSRDEVTQPTYTHDFISNLTPGAHVRFKELLDKNFILMPAVGLNTRTLGPDIVNIFSTDFPQTHDWQAWQRLMLAGYEFVYTGRPTLRYRVHEKQWTQPERVGGVLREVFNSTCRLARTGGTGASNPADLEMVRRALRSHATSVALHQLFSFQPIAAVATTITSIREGSGSFRSPDAKLAVNASSLAQKWKSRRRKA